MTTMKSRNVERRRWNHGTLNYDDELDDGDETTLNDDDETMGGWMTAKS